jgi:hypothetical protein
MTRIAVASPKSAAMDVEIMSITFSAADADDRRDTSGNSI